MLKRLLAASALGLALLASAYANQSNTWSPTTGTVSGLQLTANYNNALSAIQSCNSGASAPANDQTAAAVKGQCWLDTTSGPLGVVKMYDGANWVVLGWLDSTNHQWIANNAGGTNSLSSATTTDLGSVVNDVVQINGTTTITSFGTTALAGAKRYLSFASALTLTHNGTSLILPNSGSNITTSAGDTAVAIALGGGNWRVQNYQLATGAALTSSSTIQANNLANSALGFNMPLNLRINPTVGSGNLTLTLAGINNSAPSSVNSIPVAFRDNTVANGDPVIVSIQSSLSMTINSGSNLGASVNGTPFRAWIVIFNSGGTPVLGVINCSTASATTAQVFPLNEGTVQSPTNGAGSSAGVFYSAAGVTGNSAYRIAGYFEYAAGLSSAGVYNIAPTTVQLFGPGIHKPGDIVQTNYAASLTAATTTAPTLTALTSGFTLSITPTSPVNLVRLDFRGTAAISGTSTAAAQLYRTSVATATVGRAFNLSPTPGANVPASLSGIDAPGTASSVTYGIAGLVNTGTFSFPPASTGVTFQLDEIMGALEPTNDNAPLSAVG